MSDYLDFATPQEQRVRGTVLVVPGRGETSVTYRRFGEVDATFAHDEGEGDRSLDHWREAHRRYFGRMGRFSEDMMLMCERFRLVEIFADSRVSS